MFLIPIRIKKTIMIDEIFWNILQMIMEINVKIAYVKIYQFRVIVIVFVLIRKKTWTIILKLAIYQKQKRFFIFFYKIENIFFQSQKRFKHIFFFFLVTFPHEIYIKLVVYLKIQNKTFFFVLECTYFPIFYEQNLSVL